MGRTRLGVITDGAFNAGLTARLDQDCSTESLRIGDFVVIEGDENTYFSMIADMQLRATDARLLSSPLSEASPFVLNALAGTSTYATVQVKPMLMMAKDDARKSPEELKGPQPVRTIPMHFAVLYAANQRDFTVVFGEEKDTKFAIGMPLTMDLPVCLQLDRFVERSSGIFGQSGTGKSFLARVLLSGIIHTKCAANLIFDMHNEYAFDVQTEEGTWVQGLRQLFGTHVVVYSLDAKASGRSGRQPDAILRIGLDQIEPEDILLLADELDLTPTAATTVGLLRDEFGSGWLQRLLAMSHSELETFCDASSAHLGALEALQRKLREVGRQPYVVPEAPSDAFHHIVTSLENGKHVILQFGQHNRLLDYMLVANIVTRQVREHYRRKVERFEDTRDVADRPKPLVITIEEAHKFLNPAAARQTTFGTIARELRKFLVTLLVIDQRPSGIDSEVLSQLGTRVTAKLTEESDIEAVLTGVGGRSFLRSAIESLNTKQEILVMGHAVPMPIQLRSRLFDKEFYRAVGGRTKRGAKPDIADLFN